MAVMGKMRISHGFVWLWVCDPAELVFLIGFTGRKEVQGLSNQLGTLW